MLSRGREQGEAGSDCLMGMGITLWGDEKDLEKGHPLEVGDGFSTLSLY